MQGEDKDQALPPGTKIGEYEIQKVLGVGGFGITYLMRDEGLKKDFALKEYFPEGLVRREGSGVRFAANPKSENDYRWGKKKFYDEAQLLAQFSHPNIVSVKRVFEANDTAYMVLDLIKGGTLEQWLQRLDSPPTQDEIDLICAPLLAALELVHANSVFHLDFSPENVMIREADGVPILLDFGASRFEIKQHSQLVSALLFKSGYSAPEQYVFNANMFGAWTDIYAFGATLYRAITGTRPTEATARQMKDDYKPAAKAAQGKYRDSFLQAIDWAVKLPPDQRPKSISRWRPELLKGSSVVSLTSQSKQRDRLKTEKVMTPGGTVMLRPGDMPRSGEDDTLGIPGALSKIGAALPVQSVPGGMPGLVAMSLAGLLLLTSVATHFLSPGRSWNPLTYILSTNPIGTTTTTTTASCGGSACWGAVVQSNKTKDVFARVKEPSQDQAEKPALAKCNQYYGQGDCQVIAVLNNRECWAQAILPNDEQQQRYAKASTMEAARDGALSDCRRTLGGCVLAMTMCADGTNVYQRPR